jgi:hypothetical protein
LPKPEKLERLEFPFVKVAEAIAAGWANAVPAQSEDVFQDADIPDLSHQVTKQRAGGMTWSLLKGDLREIATKVVLDGTETALAGVPIAAFGDLETVDRWEIEGFRGISNLLQEYIRKQESKPVSIAVFGPPGSGKSFGVKEIARGLTSNLQIKTFNLSQFASPPN